MQEKYLYEYAVIRLVPHVEREEFMNVGVVLYCGRKKFLKAICQIDEARIKAFCPKLDVEDVAQYLRSFERICVGGKSAGPIGFLGVAERFRWLTATRSTVVQSSKVHPGFCDDPDNSLHKLFEQQVL